MRITNSSDCSDGSWRTSIRDEKGGDNNDDVDLGDRRRFTYSSADRGHREAAKEMTISFPKNTLTLELTPRCRKMKLENLRR